MPPTGRCAENEFILVDPVLTPFTDTLNCLFHAGYTQCRDATDQVENDTTLLAWAESAVNETSTRDTATAMEGIALASPRLDDLIKSKINESTKALKTQTKLLQTELKTL